MSETKKKKTFLGLFSIEEDAANPATGTSQTQVSPGLTPSANIPASAYSNPQSSAAPTTINAVASDNEFVEKVRQKFKDLFDVSNIPGPDYYEFRKTLDELSKENSMPEGMLYKMCFTSIKAMNPTLTKEILLTTLGQYIEIFKKDQDSFMQQLTSTIQAKAAEKQGIIDQLSKRNLEIQSSISQLQQEQQENQKKINDTQVEMLADGQKGNARQASYTFVSQAEILKLSNDLQKINEYLN